MDKLKGHTYQFSPYQYMEVQSHIDPELTWIVYSSVEDFIKSQPGNTYKVYGLFHTVSKAVSNIIAERENVKNIPVRVVTECMFSAYQAFNGDKGGYQNDITERFLIYAVNAALTQARILKDG